MDAEDWSIQEVARLAGTTSRTLRHYDDIGLLKPARLGANGYRYYDQGALVRLQRILLLRELGLGLPQISAVLERAASEIEALQTHLAWLRQEQARIARQAASVQHTIDRLREGKTVMAKDMFDGFDHTRHRDEVERRWGHDAYAQSDTWWRSLAATDKVAWKEASAQLARDWTVAASSGAAPAGEEGQALAERHVAWLRSIPGTPAAASDGDLLGYVQGLGELYVADERFAANYGGPHGAAFVRDALHSWATRQ